MRAVRHGGVHKVLFGSNGPLLDPALELDTIVPLGLPSAHRAPITGGNTRRLPAGHDARALSASGGGHGNA